MMFSEKLIMLRAGRGAVAVRAEAGQIIQTQPHRPGNCPASLRSAGFFRRPGVKYRHDLGASVKRSLYDPSVGFADSSP